jgi:hypothetical protein
MTKTAQGHTSTTITTTGAGGAHIGFMGRPRILMNQADPGGGSRPGSQGGQPAPGQGQGGNEGGESALSEAAKREVGELVNAAVNGAVTNHLTRFKKQFTEEITSTLNSTLSPIGEQLKALAETQATRQQQAPGKGQPGEIPQEIRDSMLRYENRIKELEQQNKAEREAREVEKSTRLREEERNKLATVLREKGIPDVQVRAAVALLHTEDKRVARTDDGRVVFKGVDEWLKTDEGKAYMPARQAAGSGGQPARQGASTPGDKRAQATNDLAKILLGGGVG